MSVASAAKLVPVHRRLYGVSLRSWVTPLMVIVLAMINFGDKSVLGLAAGPITTELGLSASTYGLVASSFFLLFSLSALLVGFVANRVQTRWILLVLAIVWSLAQIPLIAAASITTLFVSRIVLGAAEGPTASLAVHSIFKWFPPSRRAVPGTLYTVGAGLGVFIAAPLLTSVIVDHGWRSAFLSLAVVGAVWSIIWIAIGREGPNPVDVAPESATTAEVGAASVDAASADRKSVSSKPVSRAPVSRAPVVTPTEQDVVQPRVPYQRLFLSRTWAASAINGFGAYWSIALGSAFVPLFLTTQRGFSPARAADAVSLYALIAMLAPLTISIGVGFLYLRGLSSRWTRGAAQSVTVLIAAAGMLVLPHVSSTPGVYALIAVAFGLSAVAAPMSYLTTAEITPTAQRGASLGASIAVQTLPGLFAPSISGWLIDAGVTPAGGYRLALTVAGLIMAACGLFALFVMNPDKDARRFGLAQSAPATSAEPIGAADFARP